MTQGSNKKELAANKLILLYIIERMNIPVSNLQITELVLENKFMNYFLLQQYIDELRSDALIFEETSNNKTCYSISNSGKQALKFFINLIPSGIKSIIDESIPLVKKSMKEAARVTADFLLERADVYSVTCRVHEENFSLIDLRLSVGTKQDAMNICDNWKKNGSDIYLEVLESLLKKR